MSTARSTFDPSTATKPEMALLQAAVVFTIEEAARSALDGLDSHFSPGRTAQPQANACGLLCLGVFKQHQISGALIALRADPRPSGKRCATKAAVEFMSQRHSNACNGFAVVLRYGRAQDRGTQRPFALNMANRGLVHEAPSWVHAVTRRPQLMQSIQLRLQREHVGCDRGDRAHRCHRSPLLVRRLSTQNFPRDVGAKFFTPHDVAKVPGLTFNDWAMLGRKFAVSVEVDPHTAPVRIPAKLGNAGLAIQQRRSPAQCFFLGSQVIMHGASLRCGDLCCQRIVDLRNV